jgi:hypothetical protein
MDELKKEIPETMDVIVAGLAGAGVIKSHLADGIEIADLWKIVMEYFSNSELQEKFKAAFEGAFKIPGEMLAVIKDLNFEVIGKLIAFLIAEIKKFFS